MIASTSLGVSELKSPGASCHVVTCLFFLASWIRKEGVGATMALVVRTRG